MPLNRRDFILLTSAAASTVVTRKLFADFTDPILPAPDFTYREGETRFIAGLRPYRKDSYRLEIEARHDKLFVHNYGHGGAGITMSWGCAHEVLDLVHSLRDQTRDRRVAVLGAGVMGLTSAYLLTQAGYQVTIYAKDFLEETTSHVAGGQWAPSSVAFEEDADGLKVFHRILRRSYRTHESKLGKGFGVSRVKNFTDKKARVFSIVPPDLIPEPEYLEPSPLLNHKASYRYETLLIEPPIFLRRLEVDLRERGVWFRRKIFQDSADVATLSETLMVNCMGLGAGRICEDNKVVPIKGQLVLLKPQADLKYLYSGSGYIFPRRDAVVIGGSFEEGVSDVTPNHEQCMTILAHARSGFELTKRVRYVPDWILQDKYL